MANKTISDDIKACGTKIATAIPAEAWSTFLIRDAAGKVDLEATRRGFSHALRTHLRSKGEMASVRAPANIDNANVEAAAYQAFANLAKLVHGMDRPSALLTEICFATCAVLQAPFAEYVKIAKVIEGVLRREESVFLVVKGEGKFDPARIALKNPATPPALVTPKSWAVMTTPAPAAPATPAAPPVAAPAAPAPASGKGSGKKK